MFVDSMAELPTRTHLFSPPTVTGERAISRMRKQTKYATTREIIKFFLTRMWETDSHSERWHASPRSMNAWLKCSIYLLS